MSSEVSEANKSKDHGVSREVDQEITIIQNKAYGTVKKKVVRQGEGFQRPRLESVCCVDISLDDSGDLSSDRNGGSNSQAIKTGRNVEVTLGGSDSEFMRRIETCLMTMRKGEVSKFTFDIDRKSSASNSLSDSPGEEEGRNDLLQNSRRTVSTTLSLNSFSQALPSWRLNSEEKHKLALLHKTRGTELFQSGSVEAAFHRYSKAVKYLVCIPELSVVVSETGRAPCLALPNSDDCGVSVEQLQKLLCVCHLNLAACQAKESNHLAVIENCTRALAIDPDSVKALYRRAVAAIATGQKDLARFERSNKHAAVDNQSAVTDIRKDLLKAQKLEPHNKAIASLLRSGCH